MTHNYNTPEQGASDWHIPLNENFNNLSVDVEVRDLETNLSDHDPVDGSKFLATDTGAVYYAEDGGWSQIGNIADGGSGGTSGDFVPLEDGDTPSNGAMSFDGADLYAGTGNSIRNLTNIGSGGSGGDNTADFGDDNSDFGIVNGMPIIDNYGTADKTEWSLEIYCAPESQGGTLNAAGTQSDPVSLAGAFKKLPLLQAGRIKIDLATVPNLPANYAADVGSLQLPTFYGLTSVTERVWQGDQDNPDNVRFDVGNGVGVCGHGKGEHHAFHGITFPSVQSTGTANIFRHCNIEPSPRSGSDSSLLAKQGIFRVHNCTVGDNNNPSPIYSTGNARIHFKGTEILSSDGTMLDDCKGSYITGSVNVSLNGKNWENMSDGEWSTALEDASPAVTVVSADGEMYKGGFGSDAYRFSRTQI